MYGFDKIFPRYTGFNPSVPVWCLTPNDGCYTHRFFDTNPISPSGRYLAVLNMPYEDKPAVFADSADVVVVDLLTGVQKTIAQTKGWENQLGANINWDADDSELIYNDLDTETLEAFAYCIDLATGTKRKLEHAIYHVSPDGRTGVSPNMTTMRRTQLGYGVAIPDKKVAIHSIDTDDDGVWAVDIKTGKAKLLLSIKEIFERTHTALERKLLKDYGVYSFHTKWSPDGKKIMFTTRHVPKECKDGFNQIGNKAMQFCVYTCNADGSELNIAIDETQWVKGGHHTTWAPTSDYLTMNLRIYNDELKLCRATLTGRHVEALIADVQGSGHPSYHPRKNIMVTDTYAIEPLAYGDGTVPIRVIDFDKDEELSPPIRINIKHEYSSGNSVLRVDPHPVWDKSADYIVFNGHTGGCRRVFIADMRNI